MSQFSRGGPGVGPGRIRGCRNTFHDCQCPVTCRGSAPTTPSPRDPPSRSCHETCHPCPRWPPASSPAPPSRPSSSPGPRRPTRRSATSTARPRSAAATSVMNNRWGTSAEQCINVTGTGFSITSQQGVGNTSGAPVSYPAVYFGCHYTNCSPGTNLPMQVSAISQRDQQHQLHATCPAPPTTPRTTSGWTRRRRRTASTQHGDHDLVQPAGLDPADRLGRSAPPPSAAAPGRSGSGSNGVQHVISYVAPVADHQLELQRPGLHQRHEEPRRDHQLVVPDQHPGRLRALDRRRRPGRHQLLRRGQRRRHHRTRRRPPTPTPPSAAASRRRCRVTYATNVWSSGFMANVTVTNTGEQRGERLDPRLHPAQRPVDHQLLERHADRHQRRGDRPQRRLERHDPAPAAARHFGFQGTYGGSFTTPASFTLNGTTCTKA